VRRQSLPGVDQQRVNPDGLSVMITGAKSEAEARPLADDYCHTLGRTAHFKGMMQYRARREASKAASFECLPEAADCTERQDLRHERSRAIAVQRSAA
jgi:hypothetical protein